MGGFACLDAKYHCLQHIWYVVWIKGYFAEKKKRSCCLKCGSGDECWKANSVATTPQICSLSPPILLQFLPVSIPFSSWVGLYFRCPSQEVGSQKAPGEQCANTLKHYQQTYLPLQGKSVGLWVTDVCTNMAESPKLAEGGKPDTTQNQHTWQGDRYPWGGGGNDKMQGNSWGEWDVPPLVWGAVTSEKSCPSLRSWCILLLFQKFWKWNTSIFLLGFYEIHLWTSFQGWGLQDLGLNSSCTTSNYRTFPH